MLVLYSRFASSILVLPSATPEERSERGRNDQTVAARVPPRLRAAFWFCLARHQKSGASVAVMIKRLLLVCRLGMRLEIGDTF
ncbi:hypothetical protein NDU88_005171 [Pleurodeles waltl]|uniref:Secreted protein n=1 Tax=Pleurodeles waltl TaxID=8319 RepID=A0AAV7VKZ3_PLEWA|nr:hypothetical protein NDU88_005171 [Pleurodeles waltl]